MRLALTTSRRYFEHIFGVMEEEEWRNGKNDLILIMTPEKMGQNFRTEQTLVSDSTPTRNEVIRKTTYPVN